VYIYLRYFILKLKPKDKSMQEAKLRRSIAPSNDVSLFETESNCQFEDAYHSRLSEQRFNIDYTPKTNKPPLPHNPQPDFVHLKRDKTEETKQDKPDAEEVQEKLYPYPIEHQLFQDEVMELMRTPPFKPVPLFSHIMVKPPRLLKEMEKVISNQ
jgi:hypothetical protein